MLLFTWPYNFDLSHESSQSIKELSGLSPDALCRLQFALLQQAEVHLTQSKNVARGTVRTKPLRMCGFLWQRWFDSMNF